MKGKNSNSVKTRKLVNLVIWNLHKYNMSYTELIYQWIDDIYERSIPDLPHFLLSPFGEEYAQLCNHLEIYKRF